MKKSQYLAIAVAAIATLSNGASASTLMYDFEGGTDGFGPNGGFFPVVSDTIGATSGAGSLKVEVPSGAFFVGALTSAVPAPLRGNPPGLSGVSFDLTIVDEFQGAFADIGITGFGATQPGPGQAFGLSAQFADFFSLGGLAAGTYPVTLLLDSATNPVTFATGESYDEIFGDFGTGVDDLIATGFQIFISKSTDEPVTFYVDNIQALPEPMSLATMAVAFLGCVATGRRRS
ncbi:MAG: hypothetical protein AAFV43_01705 [Planctomycetota bacterium]